VRHGENEALHRAPPQQPTPSVVKQEGRPAASVKPGQESYGRSEYDFKFFDMDIKRNNPFLLKKTLRKIYYIYLSTTVNCIYYVGLLIGSHESSLFSR
jgi:hypothetical protein